MQRVVVWGPGRLGGYALRVLLQRPDEFEVVGVLAYSADKAGRDAGELAGLAPIGVAVTNDKDAVLALDADVVIFTPIVGHDPLQNHGDAMAVLRSGKNLICAHDYFFPMGISPEFSAEVAEACAEGGATVLAVGSSPGFVAERLATTLAGHCLEVDHVDVLERMDCTPMGAHIYPLLGFGAKPDDFPRDLILGMFDHMYKQTPHAVASHLGQRLDRVEVDARFQLTDRDLTDTTVPVLAGTIAGTEFSWTGFVDDTPFVTVTCRWVCDLGLPGWEVDDDWVITVEGSPSLRLNYARALSWKGGTRSGGTRIGVDGENYLDSQSWTSVAALINAIPEVVAASPGHLLPSVFATPRHRRGAQPLSMR